MPDQKRTYRKRYITLESNPEIFTSLIHEIGVSSDLEFIDIYSLDEADLTFIPRPVLALVLCFPETDAYCQQIDAIEATKPDYTESGEAEGVVWFQQTINNACGLYGLLHAVCNGTARSFISKLTFTSSIRTLLTFSFRMI